MHLNLQKSGKTCQQKILVARHCNCDGPPSRFPGSRFSARMSCDGLVCIPEPGWINILNPSTRQLWRVSSSPDRDASLYISRHGSEIRGERWTYFPGYCSMGFGRDKVSGSYKVVRMFFDPSHCEILDLDIGLWRKVNPPPYEVEVGRRTACVDGSIYWFDILPSGCKILTLDLHTEEFHEFSVPADMEWKMNTRIVNFEDRLTLVTAQPHASDVDVTLELWTMDAEEGRWTKAHSISLDEYPDVWYHDEFTSFTPLKITMQGDFYFIDNTLGLLYKYSTLTNTFHLIHPTYCIPIYPYVENLVHFHTDQVDLRTQSASIHGPTCPLKVGIAPGRRNMISSQSSVDKFLCTAKDVGAYIWIWRNQIKVLLAILFVHLLCSFSTGDKLPLPMLVWLASLDFWDIIKLIVIILVFKFVAMSSPVLIQGSFSFGWG